MKFGVRDIKDVSSQWSKGRFELVIETKASTIKNLIGKWRDVLMDRETALDNWSGSSAVAEELQTEIDLILDFINDLECLLEKENTTC